MSRQLTLMAVGDLQLGDSPTSVGYGFYSRYRNTRLDGAFGNVKSSLAEADILFGNLETTLVAPSPNEARRSALQLRGEPAFAEALGRIGFTVLNVANNHAAQHGDESFLETVALVRAAGIACCGLKGQSEWASEPALVHDVGFLGYCLRPRQYGMRPVPYAEGTLGDICRDVARLREMGKVAVVSLHWGEEFVREPSQTEVEMGRAIIDAGASLILGHHPHVTRPVERYRSGLIAYSLGNFIGDMVWYSPFRQGALLRCTLEGNSVSKATILQTYLRDDYRPAIGASPPVAPVQGSEIRGLGADAYAKAIARSVRHQRLACYRSALLNLRRTPRSVLLQLARDTIRNKLTMALGRFHR